MRRGRVLPGHGRGTVKAVLMPAVIAATLAAACVGPSPQPETTADTAQPNDTSASHPPTPPANDAPLWSAEGLEAQRRIAWLRERIPPDLGFQPGTTPWRPAQFDLPPALTSPGAATAASPGTLLTEFVHAIGWDTTLGTEAWEQTTRVLHDQESQATGIVMRWGLMDDAIAGHDVRLHMREAPGGWYIARMEERFHCSRGVTEDGECL